MGVLQEAGPSTIRLALVTDRTGGGRGGLWDGIDTTAAPLGGRGIESADLRRHTDDAAAIRAGLVVDATTTDGRIFPGERVPVLLTVWNGGGRPARAGFALLAPPGWGVVPCAAPEVTVPPGEVASCRMEVTVSDTAEPTTPYFLRHPRSGALYRWNGDRADWGEPFEAPPLRARVTLTPAGGAPLVQMREVVHRFRDQAIGEVRHPVLVVPRVDVKLDPAAKVWPTGARAPQLFTVTLQHGAAQPTAGTVTLELPSGWPAVAAQPF
jgi:hypothetical protein